MDTGDKYLLVVVDLATRRVGVAPLKTKSALTVKEAYEQLLERDAKLSRPGNLQVDAGTEFSRTKRWLERQGTTVRTGRPDRHQNQAMVESANRVLGDAVFAQQFARELDTGEDDTDWVEGIDDIVERLNEEWERTPAQLQQMLEGRDGALAAIGDGDVGIFPLRKGERVIPVGMEVLIPLEEPRDIKGRRLPLGNTASGFRSTDLRYERKPRKVEEIIIAPAKEPRYRVTGIDDVTFARQELRVQPT